MIRSFFTAILLAVCFLLPSTNNAADVSIDGALKPAGNAPLVSLCTDYTMQKILNDDIWSAKRNPSANAKPDAIVTLTVTFNEHLMKPGVTLQEVAAGEPKVLAMLKGAGVTPVPAEYAPSGFGGGGANLFGSGGQMMPGMFPGRFGGAYGPYSGQYYGQNSGQNYNQNFNQNYGPTTGASRGGSSSGLGSGLSSLFGSSGGEIYDKVLVAHATLSNQPGKLVLVAVVRPNDNTNVVKKLMAEKIANAILR